ncbi:Noggin-1, partial [Corvus brachyrhynchos]
LLLLLCLLPPPAIPGPPPSLEEPREPLLPPSSTADPTAHLLRGHPSAPVRPYSLSLSPEDYRYSPKPRHLRPGRLRRLLGSAFDPFWMATEEPRAGCSGPPGMSCRPAQLTRIKLLAWHCWTPQHPGPPNCAWRQIPYPVVAACKCSC